MKNYKRLNSIRTVCKPFGLHKPIRTCHNKLLLKLIVKSIHLNTPNNISTKTEKHPVVTNNILINSYFYQHHQFHNKLKPKSHQLLTKKKKEKRKKKNLIVLAAS